MTPKSFVIVSKYVISLKALFSPGTMTASDGQAAVHDIV